MKDAVVLGAGPNGLAAALTLARAGLSVLLVEARDTVGGGVHSAALTLPGFLHDVCSSAYPMAACSPIFAEAGLERHGLEWAHPEAPVAHPLDDGTAVLLERSVARTAEGLDRRDARAYRRNVGWMADAWTRLVPDVLAPPHLPRHPFWLARFGWSAVRSVSGLARAWFEGPRARALFAGIAGHGALPLEQPLSGGLALSLGVAGHAVGWPFARGGAVKLAQALAGALKEAGGEITCGWRVRSLDELPPARAVLCDVTPRALAQLAGPRLSDEFKKRLRLYRHGPGTFKLDWALDGPIPWRAAQVARAGTVHVGGTLEEIAASERAACEGRVSERPFVLVTQPSAFDPSRAPAGRHTAWGYCHVPAGSSFDMTERIESQMERFAPGFRDRILARSVLAPADLEALNPNLIGGDIQGGAGSIAQLVLRPTMRLHGTPAAGLYLCSSSTHPGPGVHGLCGYHAARRALAEVFGIALGVDPRDARELDREALATPRA